MLKFLLSRSRFNSENFWVNVYCHTQIILSDAYTEAQIHTHTHVATFLGAYHSIAPTAAIAAAPTMPLSVIGCLGASEGEEIELVLLYECPKEPIRC